LLTGEKMNLLEIRQLSVELSGYTHYVNSDGSDNGMNSVIDSAIKFLDSIVRCPGNFFTTTIDISANDLESPVFVDRLITPNPEIILVQTDGSKLTYIFADHTVDLDDIPDRVDTMFYKVSEEELTAFEYRGMKLEFYPKLYEGTLKVRGHYYSKPLLTDTSTNWWTTLFPRMVTAAVNYVIALEDNNTEAVRDWEESIRRYFTYYSDIFEERDNMHSITMGRA
jgi:hypothetical protein